MKNTHRENTSSNKTHAIPKSIYASILVVGALNWLFVRGSYTGNFFEKNKADTSKIKTPFFVIGLFCTPYSICVSLGSDRAVLYKKCSVSNLSDFT